jgi:hypothetical protein
MTREEPQDSRCLYRPAVADLLGEVAAVGLLLLLVLLLGGLNAPQNMERNTVRQRFVAGEPQLAVHLLCLDHRQVGHEAELQKGAVLSGGVG